MPTWLPAGFENNGRTVSASRRCSALEVGDPLPAPPRFCFLVLVSRVRVLAALLVRAPGFASSNINARNVTTRDQRDQGLRGLRADMACAPRGE